MYLFDTDILSNLMTRTPSDALQARMQGIPVDDQYTSSITLGELTYGARRRGSRRLLEQIELLVVNNLEVLSFDATAATVYGAIRSDLEANGNPIGDADTRIASIALARSLIVVTRNVRHFSRVPGLAVENWL